MRHSMSSFSSTPKFSSTNVWSGGELERWRRLGISDVKWAAARECSPVDSITRDDSTGKVRVRRRGRMLTLASIRNEWRKARIMGEVDS